MDITHKTEYFNIDMLTVADVNARKSYDKSEIIDLANAIDAVGLLQNLTGFIGEDEKIHIVAGGRRLRALNYLVETKGDDAIISIPVNVYPADADFNAISIAENAARKELSDGDFVFAISKIGDTATASQIAKMLGITEAKAHKLSQLARLPVNAIEAMQRGDLTTDNAKALSASNDINLISEVLEAMEKDDWNWSNWQVAKAVDKDELTMSSNIGRFVGISKYQEAGGDIRTDFFQEKEYVEDGALLLKLDGELRGESEKTFQGFGEFHWGYVYDLSGRDFLSVSPLVDALSKDEQEEFNALDDLPRYELDDVQCSRLFELRLKAMLEYPADFKALCTICLERGEEGDFRFIGTYLDKSNLKEAQALGFFQDHATSSVKNEEKPVLSDAILQDWHKVKAQAMRHAFVREPQKALAILGYHLSGAGSSFDTIFKSDFSGAPKLSDRFEKSVTIDKNTRHDSSWETEHNPKVLASMGRMKPDTIARGIAESVAGSIILPHDPVIQEAIFKMLDVKVREIWTPSDVCTFSRLRAEQLDAVFNHVLDVEPTAQKSIAFSKSKKSEKVKILHEIFNDQIVFQRALSDDEKTRANAWTFDFFLVNIPVDEG